MTSKRTLSLSPIRNNQIENSSTKVGVCQICGDQARIINYGVLSCSSCKTFFRRHGFHAKKLPACFNKEKCSITVETRKFCTACRFKKCLAMGMSPELIRKEDLHQKYRSIYKSRKKMMLKQIVPCPQPCLLNLLSSDQSSLTSIHWRLLSNVVHAFDTYSSVPNIQKIVNSLSIPSKNIQPNIENSLNIMSLIYTSLQSFINCTPDFRVMTSDEQCSLLQRNMQGLLAFYCVFVFRESGVFYNNNTEYAVTPLYGYNNAQRTKYVTLRLDHDLILVKLMLITLTFCSNYFMINEEDHMIRDSLLNGTFRLFGSQNVYAEILWKYMTYRYGFWEAARRFDSMIKVSLDALNLVSDIYNSNKIHRDFTENISEQCEHVLKLNGSEIIPLWGKDQ